MRTTFPISAVYSLVWGGKKGSLPTLMGISHLAHPAALAACKSPAQVGRGISEGVRQRVITPCLSGGETG